MKYTSKLKDPRFVIRPSDRIIDDQRRVVPVPGLRAEFINHFFETKDPELIKALHDHKARGREFFEIEESDEAALKEAKIQIAREVTPMVVGASSTGNVGRGLSQQTTSAEPSVRPDQTTALSPELINLIDNRISAALGTIIDLLKKDEVKEEKIMAGKPTKSFKCPYCEEIFSSGFAVGAHKKEKHSDK